MIRSLLHKIFRSRYSIIIPLKKVRWNGNAGRYRMLMMLNQQIYHPTWLEKLELRWSGRNIYTKDYWK